MCIPRKQLEENDPATLGDVSWSLESEIEDDHVAVAEVEWKIRENVGAIGEVKAILQELCKAICVC